MIKYLIEPAAYHSKEAELILNRGNGVEVLASETRLKLSADTEEFTSESQFLEFCRIHNISFPIWPPKICSKVYSALLPQDYDLSSIPWKASLGALHYKEELLALVKPLEDRFTNDLTDACYWREHYSVYMNNLFNSMTPAHLDTKLYNEFYEEAGGSQRKILRSFLPDSYGQCKQATYSGAHTITGRLKVMDGPDILTLKREYRKMIVSAHGSKGKICYLDYSSLEPRVLLYSSSNIASIGRVPQDIYSKMLTDLNLIEKLPRAAAKLAILSIMYGQGEENTVKALSKYIEHPQEFLDAVKEYFDIEKLKESLADELLASNDKIILNKYGRPIFCEDTKPYALLNYYVQSTAVDVALHGFMNIINRLKEFELDAMIRPIFILHDALLLDIHEDAYHVISKLEALGSGGIKKFEDVNFWLRMEEI